MLSDGSHVQMVHMKKVNSLVFTDIGYMRRYMEDTTAIQAVKSAVSGLTEAGERTSVHPCSSELDWSRLPSIAIPQGSPSVFFARGLSNLWTPMHAPWTSKHCISVQYPINGIQSSWPNTHCINGWPGLVRSDCIPPPDEWLQLAYDLAGQSSLA